MNSTPSLEIDSDLAFEIEELENRIESDWRLALSPLEKQKIWLNSSGSRWAATTEHLLNEAAFENWKKTDLWQQITSPALNKQTLLLLHQKIFSNQSASTFRKESSKNSVITFAEPSAIESEVDRVLNVLQKLPVNLISAAFLVQELLSIHPFADGNGRTVRLFLDLYLFKADYPPPLYETPQDLILANSHTGEKEYPLEHAALLIALAVERRLDF